MSPIVRTYVELNENQGEKSFWELTPYGEILYKVRVEHNCSTNCIYNYVVTPEEFDKETGNLGPGEIRERKWVIRPWGSTLYSREVIQTALMLYDEVRSLAENIPGTTIVKEEND